MTEEIEQHILKRYEVLKKVGSGAYGHVWRVKDRKTGDILALKKIFDAFQHSTDAQRTYRQIMFLRHFQHPNIIKLFHVIRAENDKDIYLIFQFMQADLHNAIRQGILQDLHRQYVIYQCALSLKYLHSGEVIHRDLKPSNILLNSSCKVKLCDFGLVRSVNKQDRSSPVLTEYVATRWYRAPEILLGSNEYSKAVDLWSLGCIIAQMVLNKPIFPGNSTLHQLQKILSFTGKPSTEDVDSIKSQLAKTMIDSVSSVKYKNPKQWFPETAPDLIDLMIKLLQFNPTKRLSINELLNHPYIKHFSGKDPQSQIVVSKPFHVDKDQQKLTTKDYRNLIYEAIKQDKRQHTASFKQQQKQINDTRYKDSKQKIASPKHLYTSVKDAFIKSQKPTSKQPPLLSTKDTSPKKFTTSVYTYTPSSTLKSKLDKEKSIEGNSQLGRSDKSPSFSNKANNSLLANQSLADKYARIIEQKPKNQQKFRNQQKYIKTSFTGKEAAQSPSYFNGPSGITYYSPKVNHQKITLPAKASSPTYKYTFGQKKDLSSTLTSGLTSYTSPLQKYKRGFNDKS